MSIMRPRPARVLAAIVFGAAIATATFSAAGEGPATISVTGQGDVTIIPDIAWITVGVSETARDADDAVNRMSLASTAVIERLVNAGVGKSDIRTDILQLSPDRDYSRDGGHEILGFTARTSLDVRIENVSMVGSILSLLVEDGANTIGDVHFDVADRDGHLVDARREAVMDARAKAEIYADAAEVELDGLRSIQDMNASISVPRPMQMRAMADTGEVPVKSGEITIGAAVTMVYEIRQDHGGSPP